MPGEPPDLSPPDTGLPDTGPASSASSASEFADDLAKRYDIDQPTAATLARYSFEPETFDRLRQRLLDGAASENQPERLAANRIQVGAVEPPKEKDLLKLPPPGSAEHAELAAQGMSAIASGEVAVLLLAGGMAARFGGEVKALAEVLAGLSFVDAKLADLQVLATKTGANSVPLWLMTSFRTDARLREWAEGGASGSSASGSDAGGNGASGAGGGPVPPIGLAAQNISMRLRLDGELYRAHGSSAHDGPTQAGPTQAGPVSLYAPGHGDACQALQRSGLLANFIAHGGRHVFISNVDNAAATLDPAIIGAHRRNGTPITCEITTCETATDSEVGGAPWLVDGKLQIVEAFRLPKGRATQPYINTNSLVVDAATLTAEHPLTWFEVHRQVAGTQVVQFERLIGELTATVDTTMALVERGGINGRFQPAKSPRELQQRRQEIELILAARGIKSAKDSPRTNHR